MSRRALTSLAVVLALVLAPAAAFADGAGDQQYQDPLAAPTTPKKTTKTTTTTAPSSPTPSAPASSAAPAAAAAPASSSGTQSAAASSSASGQLPRTGAPVGLIAIGGAALIASGAALRRRTASQ